MIVHVSLPCLRARCCSGIEATARSVRLGRMNRWPPSRRARYGQSRNGRAAAPRITACLRGRRSAARRGCSRGRVRLGAPNSAARSRPIRSATGAQPGCRITIVSSCDRHVAEPQSTNDRRRAARVAQLLQQALLAAEKPFAQKGEAERRQAPGALAGEGLGKGPAIIHRRLDLFGGAVVAETNGHPADALHRQQRTPNILRHQIGKIHRAPAGRQPQRDAGVAGTQLAASAQSPSRGSTRPARDRAPAQAARE